MDSERLLSTLALRRTQWLGESPTSTIAFPCGSSTADDLGWTTQPDLLQFTWDKMPFRLQLRFINASFWEISISILLIETHLERRKKKLITGAGHHVYADKPREFNEYVRYIYRLLEDFEKAPTEYFLDSEPVRSTQMSSLIPKSNHHHHHH